MLSLLSLYKYSNTTQFRVSSKITPSKDLAWFDKFLVPCNQFALNFRSMYFNPLPLLFKALLHGQKDRVFLSGHLIYIPKQERFRAPRTAWYV
jgi:hypothetical protein